MGGTPSMPEGVEARVKRSPLWPSLLFAATIASVLSVMWLTKGPYQMLDFRLLLAPVYIPLAFGIIWPIAVALQALATPAARDGKLRRNWAALILFVVSGIGWLPIVMAEWTASVRQRAYTKQQEEWRRQQQSEREAAQAAVTRGGLLAFEEPMKSAEEYALERYIDEHHLSVEELQQASDHYQTPQIMAELAGKPDCPPEALRKFFEHATVLQRKLSDAIGPTVVGPVFAAIAKNPNTPVEVLVKMVRSDSPYVRMDGVQNPNLPKAVKLEYLKEGCAYWWGSELRTVASDSNTPVDVLVCLSTKPDAAYAVAMNPHTPTSIVEAMSKSDNYWVKTAGTENLARRQANAK
jgi:hypothetical protein